jgi:glycerol-3-phosphate dehydrogenase
MNKRFFNRDEYIALLEKEKIWDFLIIGGGATGLGTALDAASRGYKTLLLEQADFAKGTSSRSTKLIHGGVRYLAQGNIKLVFEALRERGLLQRNAPEQVKTLGLIIPCYDWFSILKYYIGLKIYEWLSGTLSFGDSEFLTPEKVAAQLPGLKTKGLKGGIKYFDGQFDDSRLAISIAQTAAQYGSVLLNYCKVSALIKNEKGIIAGVEAEDLETGGKHRIFAKTVINATGVFVDKILKLDALTKPTVRPSQGVHIVLDKSFLNSESALMIPQTSDGRVLFVLPWNGHLILGTTDTPITDYSLEPVALAKEVDFILNTASEYLTRTPKKEDVTSVFAGLRPLKAISGDANHTKEISRDHKLMVSPSLLISVVGGKWTTYRKMAEDVVNKAIQIAGLEHVTSKTENIRIAFLHPNRGDFPKNYEHLDRQSFQKPELQEKIHMGFCYTKADVLWAVKFEMARRLEDVLARRTRILFLDAKAAIDAAPEVARMMAEALGKGKEWQLSELQNFITLANNYLLGKNQ